MHNENKKRHLLRKFSYTAIWLILFPILWAKNSWTYEANPFSISSSSSFFSKPFPLAPPITLYSSSLILVMCTRAHSNTWLAEKKEGTPSVGTCIVLLSIPLGRIGRFLSGRGGKRELSTLGESSDGVHCSRVVGGGIKGEKARGHFLIIKTIRESLVDRIHND